MLLALEIAFAALLCLGLPFLALGTRRAFVDGKLPKGRHLHVMVLAQLLVLGLVATALALASGLPAPGAPRPLAAAATCAAFLAVALAAIPWRWNRATATERASIAGLLPQPGEGFKTFALVCLAAGWAEELAYRGVLFHLLAGWTGSAPMAAIVSAAAFGLAHAVQGLKAMIVVFLVGLAFQAMALLAGSLVPVMIVHAAYDMAAGVLYARLIARDARQDAGGPGEGVEGEPRPPGRE